MIPFGIVITASASQSLKALSPIDLTLSGIVICFKDLQESKVLLPIVSTVFGITTCVIEAQFLNTLSAIDVIL